MKYVYIISNPPPPSPVRPPRCLLCFVGVYLITKGRAGVLPQAAAIEQEKLLVKEGYKAPGTHRVNIFPCKCAVRQHAPAGTKHLHCGFGDGDNANCSHGDGDNISACITNTFSVWISLLTFCLFESHVFLWVNVAIVTLIILVFSDENIDNN